jgi:hypothetical protein
MIAIINISKPSVTVFSDITASAKALNISTDSLYRRTKKDQIFIHNTLIVCANVEIVKSKRGGKK